MTKYSIIILALVALLVHTGCEQQRNPCLEPRTYYLKLKTYKSADTGIAGADSILPAAMVGFVDTPLLFGAIGKRNDFSGPLSAVKDSIKWFVMPDTAQPQNGDTITFFYNRKLTFLSTACGYTYVYSLYDLKTTNNSIDSARIENTEVTKNVETVHVKVFY